MVYRRTDRLFSMSYGASLYKSPFSLIPPPLVASNLVEHGTLYLCGRFKSYKRLKLPNFSRKKEFFLFFIFCVYLYSCLSPRIVFRREAEGPCKPVPFFWGGTGRNRE